MVLHCLWNTYTEFKDRQRRPWNRVADQFETSALHAISLYNRRIQKKMSMAGIRNGVWHITDRLTPQPQNFQSFTNNNNMT